MTDVRKLRQSLGYTQEEFSTRFGIDIETVRKWEQHVRSPSGPAELLLAVIAHAPAVVQAAAQTLAHRA